MPSYREMHSLRHEREHEQQRAAVQHKKNQQHLWRRVLRWGSGLVLLLAVASLVLAWLGPIRLSRWGDSLRLLGRQGSGYPLPVRYGNLKDAAVVGDALAVLSAADVTVTTPSGYQSMGKPQPYADPAMLSGFGRWLLYDKASGHVQLLSQTKPLLQNELPNAIFLAGLHRSGRYAVATRSARAACEVLAFDGEKSLFAWRCAREYPAALQFNRAGNALAMCLFGARQGGSYARFVVHRFSDEKPLIDRELADWLYAVTEAQGNWLAVGDTGLWRIGTNDVQEESYGGRALHRFATEPQGGLAVVLEDWKVPAILWLYDKQGKRILTQNLTARPKAVWLHEGVLALHFDGYALVWRKSKGFVKVALPAGTHALRLSKTHIYALTVQSVEQLAFASPA